MTVTNVHKDPEALTFSITAEFEVPVERAWELIADPRQLERWWGPPSYPATVVEHNLATGGSVQYYMTGPEGDKHGGYWEVSEAEPPHVLRIRDGFADGDGNPNAAMPSTTTVFRLSEDNGTTTMVITSTFESFDDMEQILAMGMEEGITLAIGQIDAILAEDPG